MNPQIGSSPTLLEFVGRSGPLFCRFKARIAASAKSFFSKSKVSYDLLGMAMSLPGNSLCQDFLEKLLSNLEMREKGGRQKRKYARIDEAEMARN